MIEIATHLAAIVFGVAIGWWARGPAASAQTSHPHELPDREDRA